MAVTAQNVIVGIGDFKVDSTSVGSTRGGVTITKEVEMYEKEVDQQFSIVGLAKVRETYRVSTEIAEATLANLKIIWDISNAIETGATTKTLSWGINSSVVERTLEFYGKSPEGYNRKFVVYKAVIEEVGDTALQKNEMTVFPVTFRLLPDTTKPAGKQIGYIEDTTSE